MRNLICAVMVLLVMLWPFAGETAPVTVPVLEAEAACVMEVTGKTVLYGKDEHKIMYPASTTKIVTLLVALERGKLTDSVTVDRQAADCEGSSMELAAGEKLTLEDLLYGLILVSGNDAAEAIAEHVGGNRDTFISWMNDYAARLGTVNTHFSNPHGLPDPYNHYTTAADLALIASSGFRDPRFVRFVNARQEEVVLATGKRIHLETHNDILRTYPGANGVKTGFTNDAGLCVVASAKRNGVQLVAVVLNSEDRWEDATKLLDYGFQKLGK